MIIRYSAAPRPSFRLVPSRYPPIGLFDTVSTAADAEAVMDLAGWTNDRLVSERLNRLPREQWVYGRPNASVVMASYLHVAPSGMRFNGPDLGAWYASSEIATAAAEVAHHLRREAVARKVAGMTRVYRTYAATLLGDYRDLRNLQVDHPDLYSRPSYDAGQIFGESIRQEGGAGILFDSLRRRQGCNIVAYRPTNIIDVVQADHYEVSVEACGRTIQVKRLTV
ncbi:RES family NAD+ phosphorylase [Novosphingobium sp. CCH12-A3]|uniref:RES family NAD+ phosphorylase n=1 Tax=Novosphingobium sp. CCH12-A3 TaxID=1768752 RepID=UPI0007812779|nr:RES family NAD+ phosphorylase [Novosphingobium sp. CCH12-A3]